MSEVPDIVRALQLQAGACANMGSPLGAALLTRAADNWLAGGPTQALLAPWASEGLKALFEAAVPLRLLAAWRELALSGADLAVADAYARLEAEAIWAAAVPAMSAHADRLAAFMTHEPQTNEVRRSIALLGGFLEVAAATNLPLRVFEIAASAGLNLSWDRYRYDLAGAAWGDPDARVRIDTDWSGPLPPLDAELRVVERAACDRRPTDLADPDQRRRLISYIWADQPERLARIEAAIDVAVAGGVRVEAADALDWLRARVRPQAGAATVLYHSVFWTYMSEGQQAALTAAIDDLGAQASAQAPFAWLRMEPKPNDIATMDVRLTLWPGGEERLLAESHPHAARVRWQGAANPS
jgi:hypothetical protein